MQHKKNETIKAHRPNINARINLLPTEMDIRNHLTTSNFFRLIFDEKLHDRPKIPKK